MLEVAAEEGRDVGASLRDDEVVDVEQLRDARERRVSIVVARGAPGVEGRFLRGRPGDYGACFVFAFQEDGSVEG